MAAGVYSSRPLDSLGNAVFATLGSPSREDVREDLESASADLEELEREAGDRGLPRGVVERIRVVTPPRNDDHVRIWEIVPDDPRDGSQS